MSSSIRPEGDFPFFTNARRERWKRRALAYGIPVLLILLLMALLWNTFFHYVPPGRILVIVAKNGDPLPPNEVVADPGHKGIQRAVLGEGWHFVLPIVYTTELH